MQKQLQKWIEYALHFKTNFFQLCDNDGNVLVAGNRMARCNHSTAGKLTNDLMSCLFTVDAMAMSILYGQECNIHAKKDGETAKGPLDKKKLDAMKGNALLHKIKITVSEI